MLAICLGVQLGFPIDTAMGGEEFTEGGTPGAGGTGASVISLALCCFKVVLVVMCTAGKGRDW